MFVDSELTVRTYTHTHSSLTTYICMQAAAECRSWALSLVLLLIRSQELIDSFGGCTETLALYLLHTRTFTHTVAGIMYEWARAGIHAWLCKWVCQPAHRGIILSEPVRKTEQRGNRTKGRHSAFHQCICQCECLFVRVCVLPSFVNCRPVPQSAQLFCWGHWCQENSGEWYKRHEEQLIASDSDLIIWQ